MKELEDDPEDAAMVIGLSVTVALIIGTIELLQVS